jgi:hypothetical protein
MLYNIHPLAAFPRKRIVTAERPRTRHVRHMAAQSALEPHGAWAHMHGT